MRQLRRRRDAPLGVDSIFPDLRQADPARWLPVLPASTNSARQVLRWVIFLAHKWQTSSDIDSTFDM